MSKKITKLTKNAAFYLGKCIWWPLVKDFMPNHHPPSDHYPRANVCLTDSSITQIVRHQQPLVSPLQPYRDSFHWPRRSREPVLGLRNRSLVFPTAFLQQWWRLLDPDPPLQDSFEVALGSVCQRVHPNLLAGDVVAHAVECVKTTFWLFCRRKRTGWHNSGTQTHRWGNFGDFFWNKEREEWEITERKKVTKRPAGIRTGDLLLTGRMLFRLSHSHGLWWMKFESDLVNRYFNRR